MKQMQGNQQKAMAKMKAQVMVEEVKEQPKDYAGE